MNKNILSLSAILIASTLSAEESCIESTTTAEITEQIVATTEVVEQAEQTTTATEAFIPRKFTLTYTVTKSADASNDNFDTLVTRTKGIYSEGRRNSPDFYQKLLKFIKELQEAIFAGLNLVGVATTQEEVVINAIGSVASEIVEQVAGLDNSQDETTKSENEVILSYEIILESAEKATEYEALKEQMIELANSLNNPATPSETVAQQFSNFIVAAQELNNGVTTVSASVDHALPSENEEISTEEITA